MIDSLEMLRAKIEEQETSYQAFGLEAGTYGVITLHRPSNVDDPVFFEKNLRYSHEIANELPLVFPIHPRTRRKWRKRMGFCLRWREARDYSCPNRSITSTS